MKILAETEALFARLAAKPKTQAETLRDLIVPTLDKMQEERDRKSEFIGIPTGIPDLEVSLGGIRPGEL